MLAAVEHAASQFGLLTLLCAFPGSILAGFSGFAIERTGFVWFFIWTSLIGIPVALLASFVRSPRRNIGRREQPFRWRALKRFQSEESIVVAKTPTWLQNYSDSPAIDRHHNREAMP